MKKFAAVALAAGIATASCSGHSGSSGVLPAGPSAPQGGAHSVSTAALPAAPSGWANTNTQALTVANASDLGAANSSQSISVVLGLALHNRSQLASLVSNSQEIDDATFLATYAPTSSEVSALTSYLQARGFSNVATEPDHLIVSATGTIAQAQNAFNTAIRAFNGSGTSFIANVSRRTFPNRWAESSSPCSD